MTVFIVWLAFVVSLTLNVFLGAKLKVVKIDNQRLSQLWQNERNVFNDLQARVEQVKRILR